MDYGEAIPVDTSATGARIETIHARFDLTLTGSPGSRGGEVLYTSPGGRHYFLFDETAGFTVRAGPGITPDSVTVQPESCPSAALVMGYTLEPGEHRLNFFNVESSQIAFVVHVAAAVHDHGHYDHSAP